MKKFIISFLLLSLTGCALNIGKKETTQKTKHTNDETVVISEPVIVVKKEYVSVPANLLEKCEIAPPPSIKEYLKSDWTNKEAKLSVYIKALLQNITICNSKIFSIKQWNQSQKDIYDSQPKVE